MSISITKRDGSKEPFNADLINKSIERACAGLTDPIGKVIQIATETRLTLYDGITTQEMDQATINAALQNVQEDNEYDTIATRLLLKTVYKRVVGEYENDTDRLKRAHRDAFPKHIRDSVAEGQLEVRMVEKYDLEKLADALDMSRDELFNYAGASGLLHRYSMKSKGELPKETPQYFFMRIAMGLSFNEEHPTEQAIEFYNKMSQLKYVAGGSTNVSAGTTRPSLSNCFLIQVEDDMGHIAKSVSDVIMISKATGGLGVSMNKLRATGSPLSSNNTASTGPAPFAKIMDTAIRAVARGGKKKGALCFYMETWHLDFPEFIDWKHNAGDDYLRMRTANTAAWISDEFMKRVKSGSDWYLFDPKETPDLTELYGAAFSKRYAEYVEKAERKEMRIYNKMPAAELYTKMLVALQTTSHPWLCWKDAVNVRALNNNTGTIHMSNLCTEICLPQDVNNIAVCNLASLNLSAHIVNKDIDWKNLESSVRLAVRQLDNLVDINILPIKEAIKSDHENRAIGLGVMGLADALEKLGYSYDHEEAWNLVDKLFEFVSYMAIDESANLAQIRGSYTNFAGSEWSKGKVPIDTLRKLEADRGIPVTVDKSSKWGLDWDSLRTKVKGGMRNATLMAIAPNANIGLLAATTPGIDARFAQMFSRNKISGKYLDINANLVKDLKALGIWEKVRGNIIENQGDIAEIAEIPQTLKDIYKTAFTTSPYSYIEVAARAQKWVDQALSRNMYLDVRDTEEMMNIYNTAWEKGLKTTYYLHMKPRHTAEQSNVRVNKSEKLGKKGFGAVAAAAASQPVEIIEEVRTGGFSGVTETPIAPVVAEVAAVFASAEPVAVPVSQPVVAQTVVETIAAVVEGPMAPRDAVNVAKGKKPLVCPVDPQELLQCEACQ